MKVVSDQEVKDLIKTSDKLVMIQLSAAWCPSCVQLKPKMVELAESKKEIADIVYLDVDKNQETAAEHGVRGIPTVLVYKGGLLQESFTGNKPLDFLEEVVAKYAKPEKLNINEDF